MEKVQCIKCKEYRLISDFYKRKDRPLGRVSHCKFCQAKSSREYHHSNKEYSNSRRRKYHFEHRERALEASRQYYQNHKEQILEQSKEYRETYREEIRKHKKEYREANLEIVTRKQKEHRQRNIDKIRAYDRERHRSGAKEWRAHYAVSQAKKRGEIVEQPCEICGALPTEAHHDDYSKPLEVRHLCKSHHRLHHAKERRSGKANIR